MTSESNMTHRTPKDRVFETMDLLLNIVFMLSFSDLESFCLAYPLCLPLVYKYQVSIADHIMSNELVSMRDLFRNYAPPRPANGPRTFTLHHVYWMHRRHETAKHLATTIVTRFFGPTSQKKLEKMQKYLILLTYYLEMCRHGLMNYPQGRWYPERDSSAFANIEVNVLRDYQTSHNTQDLLRLCGLYKLVSQMLQADRMRELSCYCYGTDRGFSRPHMAWDIHVIVPQFLFLGGLEAVCDSLMPADPTIRLQYFISHLRRMHGSTGGQCFEGVATIPLRDPPIHVLPQPIVAWIQRLLPTTGWVTSPLIPGILYERGISCFAAVQTVDPLAVFDHYIKSEDLDV
ncbi:hypothetical protein P7C71_g3737, partial [Lecanoromycetidae sp. Uapishka_2]